MAGAADVHSRKSARWFFDLLIRRVPDQFSACTSNVRHELFHAIQWAYDQLLRDYADGSTRARSVWTIEGTATAASRSSATMLRDLDAIFPVHTVTDDLTDSRDNREYSAQDFWVYYGLRTATSIAYLRAVFEKGGTPEHVDAAIALADAYWTWVKNQAFEKVYTLDGTLTNGRCTFESAAFGTLFNLPLRFATTDHAQGTLDPLSSVMVEVTIDASVEVGFIHAENDADSDDLRYKVYRNPSTADCDTTEHDGPRAISVIQPGQKYYVLLSNVSTSDRFNFVVQVSPGPLPE